MSLCPFPACPETYPVLGFIPGDATDPCESCQQPCLAREPAWTWLGWLQFGGHALYFPLPIQERAPRGQGVPMPSLFLFRRLVFAVSPARCDSERSSLL